MQSKTSFFNPTAFKKDLTRFAPLWGLYALCLILGLMLLTQSETNYWLASAFAELPMVMAPINLVYALLAAAVLFGDLFQTRMCNALHAMPLRRESWFVTHTLAGLLFSIVPTILMALVSIPLLAKTPVTNAWQLSLYWLAATNLEYLFFFGVAALCVQCVGSWVGLASVYALVNLGSGVLYLLVKTLFAPLLPGVVTRLEPFRFLCPMLELVDGNKLIEMHSVDNWVSGEYRPTGSFVVGDGWGYLFGCTALGLVLLGAACLMYHRRKLESAGDFLAIRALKPVALVGIALVCATGFQMVCGMAGSKLGIQILFAFIGLAVGWFAAQMLLARNTRVFALRNWLGLAILALVLGASLGLTKLDPLGIRTWVPALEQVESITLNKGYRGTVTVQDSEGLSDLLRLQQLAIETGLTDEEVSQQRLLLRQQEDTEDSDRDSYYNFLDDVNLTYHLANGRIVQRRYNLITDSEAGQLVRKYTSTVAALFGNFSKFIDAKTPEDLMNYVRKPKAIEFEGADVSEEYLTADTVERLFEAIIADCEEGTLSQCENFHPVFTLTNHFGNTYKSYSCYLHVKLTDDYGLSLNVYADSANILAWAESIGIGIDTIGMEAIG